MKKSSVFIIVLIAWASAAGVAVACDNICVKNVTGEATVIRAGQTISVKEGDHLAASDVVKTSADGSVDLALRGQAGCRVTASSAVELKDTNADSMKFKVDYGAALFNIEKLPEKSTFEIQTQTAIAAVRGTQLLARSSGGSGSFVVRDGLIDVRIEGSDNVYQLTEGQAFDIPEDFQGAGGLFEVRQASGQEMTLLDQASTIPTCG